MVDLASNIYNYNYTSALAKRAGTTARMHALQCVSCNALGTRSVFKLDHLAWVTWYWQVRGRQLHVWRRHQREHDTTPAVEHLPLRVRFWRRGYMSGATHSRGEVDDKFTEEYAV